ncbi:MAG: Dabb family protein, partial [Acidobacteriota bacterium]
MYVFGTVFLFQLGLTACSDGALEGQLAEANQKVEALQSELSQLQEEKPALIHTVFFWLNDGVTEEEKAAFVEGCRSLARIGAVQSAFIGPPAPTAAREVVDHSYDTALILH